MALDQTTVDTIKVVGIIGSLVLAAAGFCLSAFAAWRGVVSRRLLNYQEIIKSHRDLWKLTLDDTNRFSRVLETNPDLIGQPLTDVERRFINMLLLHITAAYYFSKHSDITEIEKLKEDIDEVLALPIPRAVWQAERRYYNKDFVDFVERPARAAEVYFDPELNLSYAARWNILVLSAFPENLIRPLSQYADRLMFGNDSTPDVTPDYIETNEINLIVCFGYGRILPSTVLDSVVAVNLHPGLLPHYRGPNPNLWAMLEEGPRGVSIHYVDRGIDTGDLIAQRETALPKGTVTLQASFDNLIEECSSLFAETWPLFRAGKNERTPQKRGGSKHSLNDQQPLSSLLSDEGLALPIDEFRARAKRLLKESAESLPEAG